VIKLFKRLRDLGRRLLAAPNIELARLWLRKVSFVVFIIQILELMDMV
jgi:hypothetical protein